MSNVFPTVLNDWEDGEVIESGWADAVEAKIGADNSAVATSLDYLVKNASSTDPGHKHPASKIVNVPAGSIAATTVQAAIDELDTEKEPASADFTAKVSAASDTVAGKVELATIAETTTGTDATRAVTPDGFAGSDYGKRVVGIQVVDSATNTAVGDGKAFFRVPAILNEYNLVAVAANVYTAGTTGTTDVQIRNVTDSQDILSTKMTIDSGETDTSTAATPAVINAAYDNVVTGDKIAIDVDAISTTAAKGLFVELTFQLP